MLASKVGLVISGADHKLSITELDHSRGKNNEKVHPNVTESVTFLP
jgi:hypothetical protein